MNSNLTLRSCLIAMILLMILPMTVIGSCLDGRKGMAVFKLDGSLNSARLCNWEAIKVFVNCRAHDRLTHR